MVLQPWKFFQAFVVVHITQISSLKTWLLIVDFIQFVKVQLFYIDLYGVWQKVATRHTSLCKMDQLFHKEWSFQTWDLSYVDHYKCLKFFQGCRTIFLSLEVWWHHVYVLYTHCQFRRQTSNNSRSHSLNGRWIPPTAAYLQRKDATMPFASVVSQRMEHLALRKPLVIGQMKVPCSDELSRSLYPTSPSLVP